LDLFLDNLDPSVVGQAGSSIAQTIAQGTSLLALTKSGADRALVIMSDGEAFEPRDEIATAARRAREAGVSLVTVGFGTAQGAAARRKRWMPPLPTRRRTIRAPRRCSRRWHATRSRLARCITTARR